MKLIEKICFQGLYILDLLMLFSNEVRHALKKKKKKGNTNDVLIKR